MSERTNKEEGNKQNKAGMREKGLQKKKTVRGSVS